MSDGYARLTREFDGNPQRMVAAQCYSLPVPVIVDFAAQRFRFQSSRRTLLPKHWLLFVKNHEPL